mmetsp:Transcript_115383/g.200245  ORF Transcript_115383/g.200245 Transcript_115383/m.200245 type:complete len:461 (-) Transcript_115383:26-1408(-)
MGKKGKKKKNVDPALEAQRHAEELEEQRKRENQIKARDLRERCEREEKDFHQFLMEREKINYFWIVEKKTLTEKQADLRNKEREYQDLEERQQIELKMFQQRLKHLRYHQQDEIVELKTDAEMTLKLQEDHHRVTEAEIKKDKRALTVEKKENETSQEDFIRMLKLEQDQKILELRQEFDRRARDMQQKYELRMKTIRDEMEKQRRKQIQKIEEAKTAAKQKVMQKNQKDFQEIKVYYGDITNTNLDLIKRLKEEHHEIKKRENSEAKQMFDLEQKNKQLKEPLKRALADVEMLVKQLAMYGEDKKKLADVKAKIKQTETMLHRMEFQHEVLQQQLSRGSKERDELYSKFQHAIYDVQQKSGLKNLLLEKKIDAIEESLETTEAQVSELLTSANVDQATASGISQKLDQVIAYKDDIVAQLQEEVQRIKESHRTMVSTYESKLAEYGIPPEELGFTPVVE